MTTSLIVLVFAISCGLSSIARFTRSLELPFLFVAWVLILVGVAGIIGST